MNAPFPADAPAGGLRVLVVDDDRDNADSLALMLATMGHDARPTYGGPQALEAAAAWPPDVALVDLAMPGMDGMMLAHALRAVCPCCPRLVAVTGYGDAKTQAGADAAGYEFVFVKPVNPVLLQGLLTALAPRA